MPHVSSPDAATSHFVLTRFNIASPGREAPIRNSPGWLERRFALFEQYCLPSMAAQTARDFVWLIYFDENTPQQFRNRIERARGECAFTPRFVGPFSVEQAKDDVQAILSGPHDLVLTTRLDNDDAVSNDFITRIRNAAEGAESGTVLNFTYGLAMNAGRIYTASDHSNPFTTMVERQVSRPQTVWSAQHHELGQKYRVIQIEAPPVWLQVVHGENVTNRIRGKRLEPSAMMDAFTLPGDVQATPASAGEIAFDNLVLAPARLMRETIFRLVKPLVRAVLGSR